MIERLKVLSTQIQLKVNSAFAPRGECVACLAGMTGYGLCTDCLVDLPANTTHCRQCALPLPALPHRSPLCGECLSQPPPFDRVIAPWRYQFPVNRLVGRYKYQQQRALGLPLVTGLAAIVAAELNAEPERRPDLLIPSPMHPSKQRKRTFNQAEDIAEQISRAINVPWSVTLIKRRHTGAAQSGLNRHQRLVNLRQAFEVTRPAPPRIAIVDDVMTTGATARALALTLRRAGAQRVEVWTLARTPG